MIDAGAPGRGPAIERELRGLLGTRDGPRRILLTHGDPDHAGASDYLRRALQAEVGAAATERAMIDRTGWPALPRHRRLLMRAFFRGLPSPNVDRWIAAGEDVGGIEVVPMPGHTPGHVAYLWDGWLLAGDGLVSGDGFRESLGIFMLDRATARRSIETIAGMDLDGISSSHGRPHAKPANALAQLIATWR